MRVSIHQAKRQLYQLLARVAQGQEVIITRAGKGIAKLVPVHAPQQRRAGRYGGQGFVAEDFDAPLRDLESAFTGR